MQQIGAIQNPVCFELWHVFFIEPAGVRVQQEEEPWTSRVLTPCRTLGIYCIAFLWAIADGQRGTVA